MKKNKLKFPIIIVIAGLIVFIVCTNDPKEITVEQATEIAAPYFQEKYGKSIVVKSVKFEAVSMNNRNHIYRNIITISDGETKYTLFLDKNNKPLFDNVSALETIRSIDISSLNERIKPLGLELHEYYNLEAIPSYGLGYSVWFSVVSVGRPDKEAKDGIYFLLETLKDMGIEVFAINISPPAFLLGSLRIDSESFNTSIDLAEFTEKYYNLIDRLCWDEQKFDEKILELTQLGYRNARFSVSGWFNGSTIEIVLLYASDTNISEEYAYALLESMDDSYFKIGEKKTIYTLQRVNN